jgi:hypothetical protein
MLVLPSLDAAPGRPSQAARPNEKSCAAALKPIAPARPSKRRSVSGSSNRRPHRRRRCRRTPAVRAPGAPLPEPLPAPVRFSGCDAGGCNDTSGQRYLGGVGNTLLGPQGQLCTRGAVGAQCF